MISPGPGTAGGRVTTPRGGQAASLPPSTCEEDSVLAPGRVQAVLRSLHLDRAQHTVALPPLVGCSVAVPSHPKGSSVPAVRERLHTACGSGAWTVDCRRSRAPPRVWRSGKLWQLGLESRPREWTAVAQATVHTRPTANTLFHAAQRFALLAARVVKVADCDGRGNPYAVLRPAPEPREQPRR